MSSQRLSLDQLTKSVVKDPFGQALTWANKQDENTNAVVCVVLPSLDHTRLASYLDSSKLTKLSKTQLVHFVPLSMGWHRDVQDAARELYDRFPRQLRPVHPNSGEADTPWYQFPSFALCPPTPPKPHLTLQWPLKSFDVFGSWRWIHAAYGFSPAQNIITVFVSDSEGEDWQIKHIRAERSRKWQEKVAEVYQFIRQFADTAAIESRVSVCRFGLMDVGEVDGEFEDR